MFRKHSGSPRFRSCKNFFNITYTQSGYSLLKNSLHTKVYGDIRIHRPIKGTVKQVSVNSNHDKWYVTIVTDHEPVIKTGITTTDVGIDVGVTNLVTTSNNEVIKPCASTKRYDTEINELKSKRDNGNFTKRSKRHRHLSKAIRKLYDVKNRKLNDYLHKVSHHLSRQVDIIYVENLNVKAMSESKATGLNRELRNVGIARLFDMLSYKTMYVKSVNPYNTSKACHVCGKLHKMPLSKRTLSCTCGNVIDRDHNAALNILHLGRCISRRLIDDSNATICDVRDMIPIVAV